MFSFFKKRRIKPFLPKTPGYLSKKMNLLSVHLASWLGRQEKYYSITQKKAMLLVFCAGVIAIVFFIIYLTTK
jgi:hypothetical protein